MRRLAIFIILAVALVPDGVGARAGPRSPEALVAALEAMPFPAAALGPAMIRPLTDGVVADYLPWVPVEANPPVARPVGQVQVSFGDAAGSRSSVAEPDTILYVVLANTAEAQEVWDVHVGGAQIGLAIDSQVVDPATGHPVFVQWFPGGGKQATGVVDNVVVQATAYDAGGTERGEEDYLELQDIATLYGAGEGHLRAAEAIASQ